jgi:hypothetical protein
MPLITGDTTRDPYRMSDEPVKHRADGPCTNVPALARAPALCPKGDSCRRLRELTTAQITLVIGVT